MAFFENAKIDKWRSFIRLPFFRGTHFANWKKLMQIFIKDHDYELWKIISKGNVVPVVKEGRKIASKSISHFTHEETENVPKTV